MPTVYSLFGPKPQFESSSGQPLVAGKLYFYVSGSTTPKATYTDSTGTVLNTNPVVLNSLGTPANGIWGTTGAYRIVCEDSLANVLWTVDGIVGINDVSSSVSEWVASGLTPTYISTTSFSISGDQTAIFTAGRRVQSSNTGGTITSTIVSSSFGSGITTVTVTNDSGVLDSGLGSVTYALLGSAAPSVPFYRSPLLSNKNRFANGAFQFDQRNNGTPPTIVGASEIRCQDCFIATGMASPGQFTVTQVATGGPVGSQNFSRIAVTTLDATMAAADLYQYIALIEGVDIADLGFSTANARPISIGFWFRSSVAGPTFSGSVRNQTGARSYVFSFPYSTANVWQYVKIENIPGDTSGTWLTTAARSMLVTFSIGAGTDYSTTAGSWVASGSGGFIKAIGAVDLINTNAATMDIALLQVEQGSACTPYEFVPYQAGLARVQRYLPVFEFSALSDVVGLGQCYSTTRAFLTLPHLVPTRVKTTGVVAVTPSGYLLTDVSGGTIVVTALAFSNSGIAASNLDATVASGLVAGDATVMLSNTGTTRLVLTGAEL